MGINKVAIKNPDVGAITEIIKDLGTGATIILSVVAGTTMALNVTTFGVPAFVGAAVAAVTFTVEKVSKASSKSRAKKLNENVEGYIHSHLRCIITDVAKELSYMFEYQVVVLENEDEIGKLADCAVDLMLDLKDDEKFDRNTLLKKVLQDGSAKERINLLTKNGDKWKTPDVFRKPGLRKVILQNDRSEFTYHYYVKEKDSWETKNYGYRSQFLEMEDCCGYDKDEAYVHDDLELLDLCSHTDKYCTKRQYYFNDSEIDSEYTLRRTEDAPYHPLHILVRDPSFLRYFHVTRSQTGFRSFAKFLRKMFKCFPVNHLVCPVYRPFISANIPNLQNSDLTGSDFSHADFRNSSLVNCNFANCVMLFTDLRNANMSGSTFNQTLISYSDLVEVDATCCNWVGTSVLYSCVDGMDISGMKNFGGICWSGTDKSHLKMGRAPVTLDTATININESKSEQILLNAHTRLFMFV